MEESKVKIKAYKSRLSSIKKMSRELATLCDIKVCMISTGIDGTMETWPEKPEDVKSILKWYTGKDPASRTSRSAGAGGGGGSKVVLEEGEIAGSGNLNEGFPHPSLFPKLSKSELVQLSKDLDLKIADVDRKIEKLMAKKRIQQDRNVNNGENTAIVVEEDDNGENTTLELFPLKPDLYLR